MQAYTFSVISLGCPKNTVDTERLLALLIQDGFVLTDIIEESDVCLVNTCGFIEQAREEVRSVLEELAAGREAGGGPRLIVALGCLVEHRGAVFDHLAAADQWVPFAAYLELPRRLRRWLDESAPEGLLAGEAPPAALRIAPAFHQLPRVLTGASHSVYLKISEGCSNACSFCAIPGIRGPQVSRPVKELVSEARDLVASGVSEINLVAQDSSAYGRDLPGSLRLADLLGELAAIDFHGWFRLMYVYPGHLDDATLDMLNHPRFCPYVDIPLQHVSESILRSMRRPYSRDELCRLLDRIRARVPEVALRTAFITGYPGEDEHCFEELLAFVNGQQFDHVGVFTYSPEPGTAAARLPGVVSVRVKENRTARLLRAQRAISRAKLKQQAGRTVEVLVDGVVEQAGAKGKPRQVLAGRTRRQAPEIDGLVILEGSRRKPSPGEIIQARVTASGDYDLTARILTGWLNPPVPLDDLHAGLAELIHQRGIDEYLGTGP